MYSIDNQTCNQLGTSGGAKSFLRGAQIFLFMSTGFKLCAKHFPEWRKILQGSLSPAGYGPAGNSEPCSFYRVY